MNVFRNVLADSDPWQHKADEDEQLLSDQELKPTCRGDMEVRNGADFFLTHDADRHEDCGKQHEQDGRRVIIIGSRQRGRSRPPTFLAPDQRLFSLRFAKGTPDGPKSNRGRPVVRKAMDEVGFENDNEIGISDRRDAQS